MKDIYRKANQSSGLSDAEIREALLCSVSGRKAQRVLIIPPDFTRFHSNAGFITNVYYHFLTEQGARVDILTAQGSHEPVSRQQAEKMFGDIPFERFIPHDWRRDVVCIGEVPGDFIAEITDGLWTEPIRVEINRRVMDPAYDLIISPGQVVPHEVIGMANHAKNLFVGVGGSDMINKSHMVGAIYGLERMMGRDHTPVRRIFDYARERFLAGRPIVYVLTVTTAVGEDITTHGLFIGEGRECLERAIELSQEKNINFVDGGIKKCVTYLNPEEFKSLWVGNKSIYRTRKAMADGGELIVLAPGVRMFGEDAEIDRVIRKYGFCGRDRILELFRDPKNADLRENMGAAAHLIHASPDGRFRVTYAVSKMDRKEIEEAGFAAADCDEMMAKYDPDKLKYGYNTIGGEEIFFIPNPALGLWIDKTRF